MNTLAHRRGDQPAYRQIVCAEFTGAGGEYLRGQIARVQHELDSWRKDKKQSTNDDFFLDYPQRLPTDSRRGTMPGRSIVRWPLNRNAAPGHRGPTGYL